MLSLLARVSRVQSFVSRPEELNWEDDMIADRDEDWEDKMAGD